MTIEIRPIRDDELPSFVDALTTGFLERPDQPPIVDAVRDLWDRSRTWAGIDGERVVATLRSWATELTVPGPAQVPAAGISAVTVLPTYRRQGILRRMMDAERAAARDRGEVVSLLYASEYPIYGRFGYGVACRQATWSFGVRSTAFHGSQEGSVELVQATVATRDEVKAVFETWRHRQPGEIRRREPGWDFELGLRPEIWGESWKGFLLLHRDDAGAVDGYARFHVKDRWEQRQPHTILHLDDMHGLTDAAQTALWRFLAGMDWVATIEAERRSPSERLPWVLTNARAANITEQGDGMFAHLIDVPRALEARTYEREDRLVLEIVDPSVPNGRQRVAMDAGAHGARCLVTTSTPDLTVHTSAIGAAYLGGSRLRDASVAFGADEHTGGALRRADALLRTADEPWCSTFF